MLIKNARLVIKDNDTKIQDILIEKGKISKISDFIDETLYNDEIIDAKNNLTIPGGIEVHAHFREPGFEYKETIKTGSMAAAKGGYTTVMPMPNLNPTPDNVLDFEKYLEIIKKDAVVNVVPYANITKGSKGQELVDFNELNEKFGVRFFTDDGVDVGSREMMEKAMKKAFETNSMIVAHTEDMSYRKVGSSVHEGENAKKNNWIGIPSETEYMPILRDLDLSKKTGSAYHICHISAKESVDALRKAKSEGVNASGEVTIHHLLLTEDDVKDTNYKMNPPLRSREDRQALIEGLLDGTIDFLASDHAPHSESDKNVDMSKAAFGIVTIESAIPLFYTHFVKTNKINLEQFINFTSKKQAKRFGFENKGEIKVGFDADITIISEEKEKIDKTKFLSKGRNTPFDGFECVGFPIYTICGGKLVWKK